MTDSPYQCPRSGEKLHYIEEGERLALRGPSGSHYEIHRGVPHFFSPKDLASKDQKAISFYQDRVDAYDENLHLTFYTHGEDESKCRDHFVDTLQLKDNHRVLEIACGTGRDSLKIAERLSNEGELHLVDVSEPMLTRAMEKLSGAPLKPMPALSSATELPFEDQYFDCIYSFGGLGEFSDIRRALSEMVRVTKVGGRIVVGDESVPPWLRQTDFYHILKTTNPQFSAPLPLDELPVEAREVRVRYVIGGVFYLIDFVRGDGEPSANFDFEIPGIRGGTYRTRYEGKLEGVTPEAKSMILEMAQKKGCSMHTLLDEIIKAENQRLNP